MSQPLRFGHPLYGAELRLARARQLIGTLNKIPHEIAKDLSHYQPYARCVWAELLRDISNPDKHRHLTTLGVSAEFVSDRPILRVIDTESNRHTIPMRGKIKVSVTFDFRDNPIDIIEASHLVQREATALIRSYAGRFKIPPPGLV